MRQEEEGKVHRDEKKCTQNEHFPLICPVVSQFLFMKKGLFLFLMHKENRKTTILDRIDVCIYMHPGVYIPLKPCISI